MEYLRSDEKASKQEVENSFLPKKILERVTPLLSTFVPAAIAARGLAVVAPRIGKFLKGITSAGFNLNEGLQYLRGQLGMDEEEQESQQPDPYQPLLNQADQIQQDLEQKTNSMLNEPKPPAPGSPQAQQYAQQFDQQKRQASGTTQATAPQQADASANLFAAIQAAAQARKKRQ